MSRRWPTAQADGLAMADGAGRWAGDGRRRRPVGRRWPTAQADGPASADGIDVLQLQNEARAKLKVSDLAAFIERWGKYDTDASGMVSIGAAL
jgi:hypothetical protein